MFIIKANSPEEVRTEIVKLLNLDASYHRIAASKIDGKHKKEMELAKASTYESLAKFIDNLSIQPND